jgi:hypothetical protein
MNVDAPARQAAGADPAARVRSPLPGRLLRDYVRAKDENRPHVLQRVFADDARLEIRNCSAAIDFPATTTGREAIADLLVRDFARRYENVYTFCLDRPSGALERFDCDWLVVMSDKAEHRPHVGCGAYAWRFDEHGARRVCGLTITIRQMVVLPVRTLQDVIAWLPRLSYPWSSKAEVLRSMPTLDALAALRHDLGRSP